MYKFGLIGYPLGHSLSPRVHSLLFDIAGIDASYELFEIPSEKLSVEIPRLLENLDGFNVTIPYKLSVSSYLKRTVDAAALYGAVNTVDCRTFTGSNTDGAGFLRSLDASGLSLNGNVLLLGAGGAARVFAYESAKRCRRLTIVTRDGIRAKALCDEISSKFDVKADAITFVQLAESHNLSDYDIVLNATPVGMYPKCDFSPLTKNQASEIHSCFDAIYNPPETMLMHDIKSAGGCVQNGLAMLVGQAAAAQEIWLGRHYSDDEIAHVISKF